MHVKSVTIATEAFDAETADAVIAKIGNFVDELNASPMKAQSKIVSERELRELGATTGQKGLSPREEQIIRCLLNGDPNKVIANRLNITEATVKVHLKSLLRKIGCQNRTQAALWGLNNGISQEAA